jgi:hypothetical protein
MNPSIRYFHGGAPGLQPGDLIVPGPTHLLDDCPICQAIKEGRPTPFEQPNQTPERVHVTSDREYARFYASKYPRGDLYVVKPIGELRPSTEDHFETWTAEAARVISVYARFVLLTPRQRLTQFRRWRRADRQAELLAERSES